MEKSAHDGGPGAPIEIAADACSRKSLPICLTARPVQLVHHLVNLVVHRSRKPVDAVTLLLGG
jgi:hypothetical protein